MSFKSTSSHYGAFPVALHWLSAAVIIFAFIMGMRLDDTSDPALKLSLLKLHAPAGLAVGALTLIRILWWLFIDKKPENIAGQPRALEILSAATHGLLYVLLIALAASGMAMMALSGAGDIMTGAAPGPLPDFFKFAPRIPHGIASKLLFVLVVLHVAAGLYHQFWRKDGMLRRMWF